jgi:hypothetical protein
LERLRVTTVVTVEGNVHTSGQALLELKLKAKDDPVSFLQLLLALRVVGVMVINEVWDAKSFKGAGSC